MDGLDVNLVTEKQYSNFSFLPFTSLKKLIYQFSYMTSGNTHHIYGNSHRNVHWVSYFETVNSFKWIYLSQFVIWARQTTDRFPINVKYIYRSSRYMIYFFSTGYFIFLYFCLQLKPSLIAEYS